MNQIKMTQVSLKKWIKDLDLRGKTLLKTWRENTLI